MPINELAAKYLETFEQNEEFPDGLSFRDELTHANLDHSRESLARIDQLLDRIRTRLSPDPEEFLRDYANQTFLYLLAFYVGTVTARQSGNGVDWYSYGEMLAVMPDNKAFVPQSFASSVTCIIQKKGFFIPLASIQERLFEEPPTKSVAFSASGFM
ncbi:MAG: hypothetical protein OEW77_07855 [Gemmatimonadota bacterium]|nr:hypothetical protein [Gemmatimonadota bacterium]